jgi:WD40 repeat protein
VIAETAWEVKGHALNAVNYSVRIVAVATGRTTLRLSPPHLRFSERPDSFRNQIGHLRYSIHGDKILIIESAAGQVLTYEVESGRRTHVFADDEQRFDRVECLPDGDRLLVTSSIGLSVWSIDTGQRLAEFRDRPAGEFALSFDGTRFVTASARQTCLWDSATLTPLVELCDGEGSHPRRVAFSRDGARLYVVNWSDCLKMYPATVAQANALAQRSLRGRNLGLRLVGAASNSKPQKSKHQEISAPKARRRVNA